MPTRHKEFADNSLLGQLYGRQDAHLRRLEQAFTVEISSRGNQVALSGAEPGLSQAEAVLDQLYGRLSRGQAVNGGEVEALIRLAGQGTAGEEDAKAAAIRTKKRVITPRSPRQATYLEALARYDLVFGLGPAGTGKTYLAAAKAVELLLAGEVERIILTRPAVEAGERLGFLPGDLKEKIDPYLRPLYDALYDMLPAEKVTGYLESGVIEIAPLAFMRGRTLAHAFVILDEAQNTTRAQMKMALTRLGEGARMAVTGDISQVDLPRGETSGLAEAAALLANVPEIAFITFTRDDVVRHPLVAKIIDAYDHAG